MLTGKNDSNEEPTSILAKVGNAVSGVGSFLDRGVNLVKGAVYPIWPKDEMQHNIKNGGRSIIGNPLPPIKTTQASKDLGVEIISYKDGKVKFLASRTLTGDIPYLNLKQLDKIKKDLPNVTVFREENKIVIEVDVEKIIKKIKGDNPEIDEKAIKELALKAIFKKVDDNLKGLAKITGGEFKVHTDLKLLNGIAEKLYKEYDNQNQSSERTVSSGVGQSSETMASGEEKSSWGEVIKLQNAGESQVSEKSR